MKAFSKHALSSAIIGFGLVLLPSCRPEQKGSSGTQGIVSHFSPGERWTFRGPSNALSPATLTIVHIDYDPKEGPIIFVSVPNIPHSILEPTNQFYGFSEAALERSVEVLVKSNVSLSGPEMEFFPQYYALVHQGAADGSLNKCFKITVMEVLEGKVKKAQ